MNDLPVAESEQMIPYIKERKKSGVSRIIFLFAIIGIVAAICITLLKSSGGNLSGLFGFLGGKESSTTTADKETTTSPSEKEDIYDYDISTLPEGKKAIIPADLSAEKQGKRYTSDIDVSVSDTSAALAKTQTGKTSVLIICTHPYESYCNEKLLCYGDDFSAVGGENTVDALARELTVSLLGLGIGAEYLDLGITSAKNSYSKAKIKIEDYLKKHPDIVYVIDLHRGIESDSDGNLLSPITEKDGDIYAQISFSVGTENKSASKSLPSVNTLYEKISERFPSLLMPTQISEATLNQQLSPTVITLDIGTCANTYSSAENTAEFFAFIFAEAVKN